MQKGKTNEKLYVVAAHLLTQVMFCSLCAYDNGQNLNEPKKVVNRV